jgi:predicted nuclease with TOPRIM domain
MDEKDLRRLRRQDLLEMLLERTREVEILRAQNEDLTKQVQQLEQQLQSYGGLSAREAQLQEAVQRLNDMLATHEKDLEALTKKVADAKLDTSGLEALLARTEDAARAATPTPTPQATPALQPPKLMESIIKAPKVKKSRRK